MTQRLQLQYKNFAILLLCTTQWREDALSKKTNKTKYLTLTTQNTEFFRTYALKFYKAKKQVGETVRKKSMVY